MPNSTQKDYRAKHARAHKQLLEQIENLEFKLRYFEPLVRHVLHSNWPQATETALKAETMLTDRRKPIIYTAKYKRQVIEEYNNTPAGRKNRVLTQYRVDRGTFRNWLVQEKEGRLKDSRSRVRTYNPKMPSAKLLQEQTEQTPPKPSKHLNQKIKNDPALDLDDASPEHSESLPETAVLSWKVL